jgi:arylsulfatase A-like enzyme
MDRRYGWRAAGLGLIVFILLAGCARREVADISPTRRHVLLLTVDTLRNDYLSGNGYDRPTTPFLDQILGNSSKFTHAITPIPRTTPALASLLTGVYPKTTQVRTLVDTLSSRVATLAELLKERGYATLAIVSNHLLVPQRGLNRGFDVYDNAGDVRDAAETTAAALAHLRGYTPRDALFLWVHYIDPHVPYYPPAELAKSFDPGYEGPYAVNFGEIKGAIGDQAYPTDLGKEKAVYRNTLPAAVNAHVRRLYAADIRYTDDHVAELIAGLQSRFGNDWLIIFTADHGEGMGEHNYYYDHGDYVYDGTLRVPLAFLFSPRDPLRGHHVIDDWVSLIDVMPTVAELVGVSLPQRGYRIAGRSLVPYLRGGSLSPQPLFAECGHANFPGAVQRRVNFTVAGRFRSVVLGDWKLIWTPGLPDDSAYELYDVRQDPEENVNLYQIGQPGTEQMKFLLQQWADTTAAPEKPLSAADRERLRALGYTQ